MSLVRRVRIELKQRPYLRRRSELPEIEMVQHADDRVGLAAERDRFAADLGIGVEPRFPESPSDDGDARATWPVFIGGERASREERRADEFEEVRRYAAGPELLRETPAGEVHQTGVEGRHVLHDIGLLPVMRKLGRRGGGPGAARRRAHEDH